jgi:hypothetical protein
LQAFSNGKFVSIAQSAPDDPVAQDRIIQRAESLLGTQYDLIGFNCETFANLAQTGNGYSGQVLFLGILGVGDAVLLARALQKRS